MVWVHAHLCFEGMLNIIYYKMDYHAYVYHGDLPNFTVPGAQGSIY